MNRTYFSRNILTGEFRNMRCVWKMPVARCMDGHFAVYPEKLVEIPVMAGCPEGGTVLDPFLGAGTTAIVCERLRRSVLGIELNPAYVEIAKRRIREAREGNARRVPMCPEGLAAQIPLPPRDVTIAHAPSVHVPHAKAGEVTAQRKAPGAEPLPLSQCAPSVIKRPMRSADTAETI